MLKFVVGVTLGYVFHDAIAEGLRAVQLGMAKANQAQS
jgi:hypothetical protein